MNEMRFKEIEVPQGITIEVKGKEVKATMGDKDVKKNFPRKEINMVIGEGKVTITAKNRSRKANAIVNAVNSQIENMIKGLQYGYKYRMEIVYSHFPINVTVGEESVEVSNLAGEKRPKKITVVAGAKVAAKGKEIVVTGADKCAVGQTCANLEQATTIKGRDRRIFQDGIYLVEAGFENEPAEKAVAAGPAGGGEKSG